MQLIGRLLCLLKSSVILAVSTSSIEHVEPMKKKYFFSQNQKLRKTNKLPNN